VIDRRLTNELTETLGTENVLLDPESRRKFAMDGLRPYRGYPALPQNGYMPDAVVTPTSTSKIRTVVALASRYETPLVAYGAGTGLMGGATAVRGGITINLSKMSRIIRIEPQDKIVHAEAGVILEKLNRELEKRDLILGHDPWTRPLATLGGAISTNSLGYVGGEYGSIGDQVLGLKVVLADGSILSTRPVSRSSTGLNLTKLFIGTEGCLGIIAEAWIRAFPKPLRQIIRGVKFPDFDTGWRAIVTLFNRGLRPAIMDFGEPAPHGPGAVLFLGYHGPNDKVRMEWKESLRVLRRFRAVTMPVSGAERFWKTRHNIAYRYAKAGKQMESASSTAPESRFDFLHVWLPVSKVLQFKRAAKEIMDSWQVEVVEYGLWGPELFSMAVACDGRNAAQRLYNAVDAALQLTQDLGGSMEYCHGVGLRLQNLMRSEHTQEGLTVMRKVKRALDPKGILNPGKLGLT